MGESPEITQSEESVRQSDGTKEIAMKEDDGSHMVGSVTLDCKEEGCEDGIHLNLPIHEQPYGLSMEIRNQCGSTSQDPMTEMEGVAGCSNISLPRQGKMKGLSELGEPNTLPRRSVRLSVRTCR
ncbi:hypothetical protein ACSQ67_024012 [Phaseolus vulgaris]